MRDLYRNGFCMLGRFCSLGLREVFSKIFAYYR